MGKQQGYFSFIYNLLSSSKLTSARRVCIYKIIEEKQDMPEVKTDMSCYIVHRTYNPALSNADETAKI